MTKFPENIDNIAKILTIGIGGAGASVVEKINKSNINSINTILIDTDENTIDNSSAGKKFCIPASLVKELSNKPADLLVSKELSKELKPLLDLVSKTEVIFTISGLGGNTGTVVTPFLVHILKENLLWIWSLATLPFFFEGKHKIVNSLKRLKLIQQSANAVLVIPHDKIFRIVDKNLSMKEVFTPANNLCAELINNITKLTNLEEQGGLGSISISDIKNKMLNKRSTLYGIGVGSGESRIQAAIDQAFSSPLLGKDLLNRIDGLIINISGDDTVTLEEINKGIEYLRTLIDKDIDISFGLLLDPKLNGQLKVGLITCGTDTYIHADNWDLSLVSPGGQKDSSLDKKIPFQSRLSQQSQKPLQTMIDFKKLSKGRFDKSEATVYGGIDLDIPTFLRKRK